MTSRDKEIAEFLKTDGLVGWEIKGNEIVLHIYRKWAGLFTVTGRLANE
jgi:hypothetical protein